MKSAKVPCLLATLFASCALSGCIVAAEKPNFDTSLVAGTTTTQTLTAASEARTGASPSSTSIKVIVPPTTCQNLPTDQSLIADPNAKELRNACISNVKTQIHEAYIAYRQQIAKEVGITEEALDITGVAASASGAAAGKTAAKVLSAVAATVTGARTAFDSDALYKQSLTAVFKQMDADVAKSGAEIDASTQMEYQSYPMYRARFDLLEYYNAGTIQHALDNLDATAGTAKTTCSAAQTQVAKAVGQNVKLAPPSGASNGTANPAAAPSTTDQCSQLLNSADQALQAKYQFGNNAKVLLALLYSRGKFDKAIYQKIQKCMTQFSIPGEPIFFINGGVAQVGGDQVAAVPQSSAEENKAKVLSCVTSDEKSSGG